MIDTLLMLLATAIGVGTSTWMFSDYRKKGGWRRLTWFLGAFSLTLGAACQGLANLLGSTAFLARIGFLTGGVMAIAFFGQGAIYVQFPRRAAHWIFGVLVVILVATTTLVIAAPLDLERIRGQALMIGTGFPASIRTLALVVDLFGIVALLGGGLVSLIRFLWNGGSPSRAMVLGLMGLGALSLAFGRFFVHIPDVDPAALPMLFGMVLVFTSARVVKPGTLLPPIPYDQVMARRHKASMIAIFAGLAILMGAVASLPVIPWLMGIVTNVKSSYTSQLPSDNRGAYLMTDQGVMELYAWYVEPDDFPADAPSLKAANVHSIGIVQKQFDVPENYQLYSLTSGTQIRWRSFQQNEGQLILDPGPLPAGQYELVVPQDSMFGGTTEGFFQLQ